MVATNVQNKAAIKNNDNQNAAAVGNAKDAYNTANANLQSYTASHPSPFEGQTIGRPSPMITSGAFQPGNVNAASLFAGGPPKPGPNQSGQPQMTPQLLALLQMFMNAPKPPAAAAPGTTPPPTPPPSSAMPVGPLGPIRVPPGAAKFGIADDGSGGLQAPKWSPRMGQEAL